ncbi:glutaredoxin-C11-like [Diospyros lotus]|uniref:glutaredoxin-C11-like n=1 Tax=Diospyros lotus TaxID=55363 RepID=UPI002255B723|nr:glutaredoxin-C11-like [Diospyros lotus]XP_052187268.1 glutaredoxin-C11-like [Diospyros lotus]
MDKVFELASRTAAAIFTRGSCDMCFTITTLFHNLGASPAIYDLDQFGGAGREMERALKKLNCNPAVPAVFIGGKFVGSSKDVISFHVDGSLRQMLINAGAIWF